MSVLATGSHACRCSKTRHDPKLVVLTGGPGGGKTAILEMARRYFCHHVVLLPESASIVFGGGFPGWRHRRRRAPHNERSLRCSVKWSEWRSMRDRPWSLCDRGSLDGVAYWPGTRRNFCEQFGIRVEHELARYAAVIHVEVPSSAGDMKRIASAAKAWHRPGCSTGALHEPGGASAPLAGERASGLPRQARLRHRTAGQTNCPHAAARICRGSAEKLMSRRPNHQAKARHRSSRREVATLRGHDC